MNTLFNTLQIKSIKVKNRICVPPMVTLFSVKDSGIVGEKTVEYYRTIAKGGAGLIIQEATCVNMDGRLMHNQLGIWHNQQIKGLKTIVNAVHEEECHIFIQIHHAGVVGISKEPMCPSDYKYKNSQGNEIAGYEMTILDIQSIQADFIEAGRRAYEAGYDGVELHGCHNYLISQFLNSRVNKRADDYGVQPEKFVIEIIDKIREVTSNDFVIGVRLGGFEPTLGDGINHAKILEKHGVDFLDISYGFQLEHEPYVPEGYPFADIIYAAKKIKEAVSIPVFAANGITSPEMAEAILQETKVDMIDIGRGFLVNSNWGNDAKYGKDTGKCLHCSACKRYVDAELCAGKILFNKKRALAEI